MFVIDDQTTLRLHGIEYNVFHRNDLHALIIEVHHPVYKTVPFHASRLHWVVRMCRFISEHPDIHDKMLRKLVNFLNPHVELL